MAGTLKGILRLDIRALLVGASLLALTMPIAHAQSGGAEAMAQRGMERPGRYFETFDLDQATLTEQDRRVIAQAAEDYRPRRQATGQGHRLYRYLRFRGLQSGARSAQAVAGPGRRAARQLIPLLPQRTAARGNFEQRNRICGRYSRPRRPRCLRCSGMGCQRMRFSPPRSESEIDHCAR